MDYWKLSPEVRAKVDSGQMGYSEALKTIGINNPGTVVDSVSQGHTGYENSADFLGANYYSGHEAALVDPVATAEAQRMSRVRALRDEILGKKGSIIDAYELLFGDLGNLVKSRSSDVEKRAGENVGKLTSQYTESIPKIRGSFDALGAGDSTDTRDANISAKAGYDDSVKQVGDQKKSDLAKIGQYAEETRAGWNADKSSIMRLLDRVDETEDEGDLRAARNSVEGKLDEAKAGRSKLNTDEGARGKLSEITKDAGRFDAIKGSLDNIINSSLAGGVKAAAVQAVVNSSDLSDEDKEKVKLQYGNVYDAPAVA